ncbi:MAG: hypothetical protein HDS55_05470 [Barnesiella sp.]|nr:hypothetical protein [Barnesiella sp.]
MMKNIPQLSLIWSFIALLVNSGCTKESGNYFPELDTKEEKRESTRPMPYYFETDAVNYVDLPELDMSDFPSYNKITDDFIEWITFNRELEENVLYMNVYTEDEVLKCMMRDAGKNGEKLPANTYYGWFNHEGIPCVIKYGEEKPIPLKTPVNIKRFNFHESENTTSPIQYIVTESGFEYPQDEELREYVTDITPGRRIRSLCNPLLKKFTDSEEMYNLCSPYFYWMD